MQWLRESWGYLTLFILLIGALFKAIQATLAAERDRQALKNANLERQKLELEVRALRNTPEAMRDRRKLYDDLRQVIQSVIATSNAEHDQIRRLQELKHDCEYRFPPDIVSAIQQLIETCGHLWMTGERLARGADATTYKLWEETVHQNSNYLRQVVEFEASMVDLFRPHLSI
jgi:hypothetical protein